MSFSTKQVKPKKGKKEKHFINNYEEQAGISNNFKVSSAAAITPADFFEKRLEQISVFGQNTKSNDMDNEIKLRRERNIENNPINAAIYTSTSTFNDQDQDLKQFLNNGGVIYH